MERHGENEQAAQVDRSTMRVIHAALAGGLVVFTVVTAFLPQELTLADTAASVMRGVGYAGLLGAILMAQYWRRQFTRMSVDADLDEWWTTNSANAIIVWSTSEGAGMLGLIMGWLTGGTGLQIGAPVVALMLLFGSRPRHLERIS